MFYKLDFWVSSSAFVVRVPINGEPDSVDANVISNWMNNEWPSLKADYEDKYIIDADKTGLYD